MDQLGRLVDLLALQAAEPRVGRIFQNAEIAVCDFESTPWECAGAHVAQCIAQLVNADPWFPDEATVMRYDGPQAGIGAHRDHARYRDLIAICSLEGEAELDIVADRAANEIIESIHCRPADLVLLRAHPRYPSSLGPDPRPLHVVRPPICAPRTSVTFRMRGRVRSS